MAPFFAERTGGADDCQVVGLGASAGEDDLLAFCVQAGCDAFPRLVKCRACGTPFGVNRTRVVTVLPEERQHGLNHLGADRGGGGVVQINAFCSCHSVLSETISILGLCEAPWHTPRSSNGKRRSGTTGPPIFFAAFRFLFLFVAAVARFIVGSIFQVVR